MSIDAEKTAEAREEEIRARVEAATKGPWEMDEVPETGECGVFGGPNVWYPDRSTVGSWMHFADAEFIAQAREDVPWLLSEVESLRTQLAEADRILKAPEMWNRKHWTSKRITKLEAQLAEAQDKLANEKKLREYEDLSRRAAWAQVNQQRIESEASQARVASLLDVIEKVRAYAEGIRDASACSDCSMHGRSVLKLISSVDGKEE